MRGVGRVAAALAVVLGASATLGVAHFLPRRPRARIERVLRSRTPSAALRLLRVRVRVRGTVPADGPYLVVSNHLGYVDVAVLCGLLPVRFVAKDEIRRWPVLGRATAQWGTVFVKRGSTAHVSGFVDAVAAALAGGAWVAAFPEGTSTDGTRVLPFKTGAFAALERVPSVRVLPVHIGIVSVDGQMPDAGARSRVAWFGDATLVSHLLAFGRVREVTLEVTLAPPLELDGRSRRELADAAHAAVCRAADAESKPADAARPRQVSSGSS